LASEKEPISGRQFSRNVAACTVARAAGQSPPTALRRRQARPFTAELAPARVSPGQGLLSLLGPTIPCRGRTCTYKHVKDRRLHIGIWFLACPLVLGAARVRKNWFLGPTEHGAILAWQEREVNSPFLWSFHAFREGPGIACLSGERKGRRERAGRRQPH